MPRQPRRRDDAPDWWTTDATLASRFWAKVQKTDECWLWLGCKTSTGYGMIKVCGKRGKAKKAHRVSWWLHYGDVPTGLCVLHKCDVPSCVNPTHLFLGTQLENIADRDRKGRWNVTPALEARGIYAS